ncbi:hypothetical protein COE01_21495 [Bacillus thuringiensis]|uniref:hypothetical protein n=1 Tax=Bacillus thuringiensis TaxID=1428 RepID=UPI000BF49AAB|nr:hypothetical protein [Bacillus thuringiensis]MDC7735492.1 hypothetical protein [Bacillus thuringiensis]PFK10559.1 hypothetical protein COJ17_17725 [Bacillus thuringiensis]PGW77679.1 hypothetical protein COE01_21495 [Bacillus thuringiensis]HDR8197963.1 hypothetical protein [Bacillus thuringiensis]
MDKTQIENAIKYNDDDFIDFVKDLVGCGRLEGAAEGIAKKIIHDGTLDLSDKQIYTFINYGLMNENFLDKCGRCYNPIPWSEMLIAVMESGYCNYCDHMSAKD